MLEAIALPTTPQSLPAFDVNTLVSQQDYTKARFKYSSNIKDTTEHVKPDFHLKHYFLDVTKTLRKSFFRLLQKI